MIFKSLSTSRFICCLILCLISFNGALGQIQNFDLSSPYQTVYQLLYFLQDESYDSQRAAETIFPGMDESNKKKAAVKIKQVLDGKGLYVQLNQIPDRNNYRDSISQRFVYTLFPNRLPELYVEKIDSLWYFSAESVRLIEDVHKEVFPFGTDKIMNYLPKSANRKFLGYKIWQYAGMLILLGFGLILHFVLKWFLQLLLLKLKWFGILKDDYFKKQIVKIAKFSSIWIILAFIKTALPILQLPIRSSEFLLKLILILQSLFILFIALRLVNIVSKYAWKMAMNTESKMDEQLLPIVVQISKMLLIGIALFQILSILGVNITALIAGISIGGLALALAAQDTAKNLIGSVLIFMDKPFQIGDYVVVNDIQGTIEEVGFRTTRIRTIGTTLVSVPNGQLANMFLENFGARNYRMMNINIGIIYSTALKSIHAYIDSLKSFIQDNPKILDETYYVHLTEMKDSSLSIMFRIYLLVDSYQEEVELKEQVLYQIINEAENMGIEFAFPSSSIYIENLPEKTIT